jgi:hypothetical protein
MNQTWKITVTYTHGGTETWDNVDEFDVLKGILHLEIKYRTGSSKIIGIPLAVIRKWEALS